MPPKIRCFEEMLSALREVLSRRLELQSDLMRTCCEFSIFFFSNALPGGGKLLYYASSVVRVVSRSTAAMLRTQPRCDHIIGSWIDYAQLGVTQQNDCSCWKVSYPRLSNHLQILSANSTAPSNAGHVLKGRSFFLA
jgi:hypothetical protein